MLHYQVVYIFPESFKFKERKKDKTKNIRQEVQYTVIFSETNHAFIRTCDLLLYAHSFIYSERNLHTIWRATENIYIYIIMNSINKTHKKITTMPTQEERGESIYIYLYLLATTKGINGNGYYIDPRSYFQ